MKVGGKRYTTGLLVELGFHGKSEKLTDNFQISNIKSKHYTCPNCKKKLRLSWEKKKKNLFWLCPKYPDCFYKKTVHKDDCKKLLKKSKLSCPKCNKEMILKLSKYKTMFLGCTNYPSCKGTLKLGKFIEHLQVEKQNA